MPHRNRMLVTVVTIMVIFALAASLVSATMRAAPPEADGERDEQAAAHQSHSSVVLAEAPAVFMAKHLPPLESATVT